MSLVRAANHEGIKVKKRVLVAIALICSILTVSCGMIDEESDNTEFDGSHSTSVFRIPDRYNREQVADYIRKIIGLDSFKLDDDCKEGNRGARYWRATDDNGIEFYVVDELSSNDYTNVVSLYNNYDYMLFREKIFDGRYWNIGEYEYYDDFDITRRYWIYASITNTDELERLIKSIREYKEIALSDYNHNVGVPLKISFDVTGYEQFSDKEVLKIEYANTATPMDEIEEELYYRFYHAAMEYDIKEITDKMSDADKEKVLNTRGTVQIVKAGESEPYKYLVGHITFSNMYYILVAEGIEVEGTPYHYKAIGVSGEECEFSFEYYRYNSEYDMYESYYYENGEEKVNRTNYLAIFPKDLERMFGIQVELVYAE